MQPGNQSSTSSENSRANGHSTLHEMFVLSDEQILGIDPEPQDVEVSADRGRPAGRAEVAPGFSPASGGAIATSEDAAQKGGATATGDSQESAATAAATTTEAPFSNPEDVRALTELYPGGLNQARAAAERARLLDDIDRAYFAGDATQRAQLAAMMLREDPAAFREMVFEGLRALEAGENTGRPRSVADALGRVSSAKAPVTQPFLAVHGANDAHTGQPARTAEAAQAGMPAPQEHLAAYAAFERAANADLEKSVGGAIERALQQALPNLGKGDVGATAGAQHAAPLQARLTQAIRQDVEKALQGDRQLGEQIAQILAGRRFDDETRAQVVRLINDRALQLVPGAAKRALSDWTQATLAAHRSRNARADAASSRREVATAAPMPRDLHAGKQNDAPQITRGGTRPASKGRVDYRRLSDEQILDM
jgi:hypothetical protein